MVPVSDMPGERREAEVLMPYHGSGVQERERQMQDSTEKVRIDKWLWAARFFKTRSQAQDAVAGGKVHVNGERVKSSRAIETGDRLEITKGEQRFVVTVCGLSEKRGPAKAAEQLYVETEASRTAREERSAMNRALRQSAPHPDRKPDKKQRRSIIRFKERG